MKPLIFDNDSWLETKHLLTSAKTFSKRNATRGDKTTESILRKLGKNQDIYVSRPDKGNGVVIINRSDYLQKMTDLLSDTTKFTLVQEDCYKLSLRLENRLNSTLLSLFKSGKLDKTTYDLLRSTGSFPGKLYGLPKTHKAGVPLRPILSAVTCHHYRLAKFLVPLLSPLASSSYTISDVFTFADELRLRTDPTSTLMVSLDVESLFTNVPVAETIDIIISQIFTTDDTIYHGFSKADFTTLLNLAVNDSFFSFNDQLYKQIDGMAMGSPLGPIFANIFLAFHETKWLQDCPVKPVLYKRYVDDTLWFLPPDADIAALMSFMNSRHSNMHFTHEIENSGKINFLGLTISHDNLNGFHYSTTVYRKPTFTGLFTNYNSFSCLAYRLSVVKTLVFRALRLCSTCQLFLTELKTLKILLMRNAFPSKVIDRICNSTLSRLANFSKTIGPAKEKIYIGLLFLGKNSDNIRRILKSIAKKFLPHKDLIIYYKPGRCVSNFVQNKDLCLLECALVLFINLRALAAVMLVTLVKRPDI